MPLPLTEIAAAVKWWLALLALGTAVTPLTFTLLHRLPDRGYAFTKMVGLLLVSYLFWLGVSLGILGNNLGSILVSATAVLALSIWAYRQNRDAIHTWLTHNKRHILITELLFLTLYVLWVWVRAQNPTILNTEKPMEFAFLNAIGRSPSFPPLDPWLSGYAISYYYFGYVMISVLARLTGVAEPIAFNLGIAWLVAGTAVASFGLTYNLIAQYGGRARRAALALGLIAAIAIPLGGNLQIVLEYLYGQNSLPAEFWQWLDVRDINTPPAEGQEARYESNAWWWWRSSRPINEANLVNTPIDPEPIAEFPAFSFILGDMHPHVLALPFALLSLAVALAWWLNDDHGGQLALVNWRKTEWRKRPYRLLQQIGLPFWLFTVLVLGGLSFLNTWDVLMHLFVVLGAFLLAQWRKQGWHSAILEQTIYLAFLLVLPAILLYLPFYFGFRSQAAAPYLLPMLNRPTRLAHFFILFGLPLTAVTIPLVVLIIKQRLRYWQTGLLTIGGVLGGLLLLSMLLGWMVASSADGAWRVADVANQLGVALPERAMDTVSFSWGTTAVLRIIPQYLGVRLAVPGVTLWLAALLGMVVMVWRNALATATAPDAETTTWAATEDVAEATPSVTPRYVPTLPFALLLIATGALLTLGPEFVYLRDNFGVRMNTVFKFYYQAWVMLGIGAIFGLYYLWRLFGGAKRVVPALVLGGYTAVFLFTLLFPYYGVRSRAAEYRGALDSVTRRPATLDGLVYLSDDEYAAIQWLRNNVDGVPVILEAVGGQYSPYGRVSANTGLPTLLGWPGHEYQWRGSSTTEPAVREPAVRDIYTTPTWDGTNAALLLDDYNVELIYVGALEANAYGSGGFAGLGKFTDRLEVAYQNPSVIIYRWLPR